VRSLSSLELRIVPGRLTREIAAFVDDVWQGAHAAVA
jgi:hypothetical protein